MPSLTLHQTEVPRLLAWTQTVIVRPLKYQDIHVRGEYATYPDGAKEGMIFLERDSINGDRIVKLVTVQGVGLTKDVTPFRVGMPLWCRETWRIGAWHEDEGAFAIDYKSGPVKKWRTIPDDFYGEKFNSLWLSCSDELNAKGITPDAEGIYRWEPGHSPLRWRSPVTMPQWSSRITVTPTAVRVCRVQDVTEEEAIKLGYREVCGDDNGFFDRPMPPTYDMQIDWNKTYTRHPWASNPWVAVANVDVEVKR